MRRFADTCEAIARTTSKKEQVRLAGDYLKSLAAEDAALAAIFLSGRVFPKSDERVLAVGGSLIWEAIATLATSAVEDTGALYRKHGDLGTMAEELLSRQAGAGGLSVSQAAAAFARFAAIRGPAEKLAALEELLGRAEPAAAKYLIKIITGDLRIGLKESLVEEAIAYAYGRPADEVRRASMLTGNIGATLRLAAAGTLGEARLRLFHPVGFMLASPVESAAEALAEFPEGAQVEDKYDGIRAQAHKSGGKVKLYSRTLDEVAEFFELEAPLAAVEGEFVLDGEVVAWKDGRALPFTELQQRLGRKQPDLWLPLEIPVSLVAFDLLYVNGEVLLDQRLAERRRRLEALLARAQIPAIQVAPARRCASEEELQQAFREALARGNEGIMVKALESLYAPGRRGKWWLKWKQSLATLDVVVTAVEYGHGKRHGLLSDYTFAVRGPDGPVNIGKAYSGLTDQEIRTMTGYFLGHTVEDHGHRRLVEPTVVIEVAFNNIQRSGRHASGYALRFPRIVRLRPDKPVGEIDTLKRVEELYGRQKVT